MPDVTPPYIPDRLEYREECVRHKYFNGGPFTSTQLFKNKDSKNLLRIDEYVFRYFEDKKSWVSHAYFVYHNLPSKKRQRVKITNVFKALHEGQLKYAGYVK